jgi:NitT/TauT family transport system substrate-binding protein
MSNQDNLKNLEAIKRLLQVSPGSTILLRGHVDNSMVE